MKVKQLSQRVSPQLQLSSSSPALAPRQCFCYNHCLLAAITVPSPPNNRFPRVEAELMATKPSQGPKAEQATQAAWATGSLSWLAAGAHSSSCQPLPSLSISMLAATVARKVQCADPEGEALLTMEKAEFWAALALRVQLQA